MATKYVPFSTLDTATQDAIAELHPGTRQLLRWLDCGHLPEAVQPVWRPYFDLGLSLALSTSGPETTAGLRKLLEAKDCAVRATLATMDTVDAD